MKKFVVVIAVVAFAAGSALAGGKECCAKDGVKQAKNEMNCVSFASLNLSADQKSKLEGWQADCMKAGCTKESHTKFLEQAKTVLTGEQYAALKKECGSGHRAKTS
jgi:hypothetical protein